MLAEAGLSLAEARLHLRVSAPSAMLSIPTMVMMTGVMITTRSAWGR